MIESHTLSEYESRELSLDTEVAIALLRESADRLRVSPSVTAGKWVIKATSHVGTFAAGNTQIVVKPKVKYSELLELVVYSTGSMRFGLRQFDYQSNQSLLGGAAAIFARLAEQTFVSGVDRDYVTRRENLIAMRGRLDIAQLLGRGGLGTPLPCRYEEQTMDTPRNRIVFQAALTAAKHASSTPALHHRLMSIVRTLDEVSAFSRADFGFVGSHSRLNSHYAPLIVLAKLIIDGSSIRARPGAVSASSFTINMNQVFEDLVSVGLQRHLGHRWIVTKQHKTKLDEANRFMIEPDVVISDSRRTPRYVVDAKYKVSDNARARVADLYQLHAYSTVLDLPEGLLVYATADADPPMREVIVRHSGKILRSTPLNLTGGVDTIDRGLRSLAAEIETRIAGAKQQSEMALA